MITESELLRLMTDLESDRVERTRNAADKDKLGRAICAFANDLPDHRLPGYLLIGLHDDGSLSGLKTTDEILRNIAGIRSDGLVLPYPAMNIHSFTFDGADVVVVEVSPADMPPVRYKDIVRIRVGPRRGDATPQEERILAEKRISGAKTYDAWPCKERTLDDLALGQFDAYRRVAVDSGVIAENQRSLEHQLASLRFFDLKHGCPTNAGIIAFGKNPRFDFDGAYVQYLRFPGTSMTDKPIDDEAISGDLPSVVDTLTRLIKVHTTARPETVKHSVLIEQYVYNVHPEAVREIIMNALMHRDYQSSTPIRFYWYTDRVEVQNPGGLYGEVTAKNFGLQNSYRNPIIAEAMKVMGAVNKYGYGITRARELMRKNGNPEPEFVLDQPYFAATLRFRT